jgi:hypothetical protein
MLAVGKYGTMFAKRIGILFLTKKPEESTTGEHPNGMVGGHPTSEQQTRVVSYSFLFLFLFFHSEFTWVGISRQNSSWWKEMMSD